MPVFFLKKKALYLSYSTVVGIIVLLKKVRAIYSASAEESDIFETMQALMSYHEELDTIALFHIIVPNVEAFGHPNWIQKVTVDELMQSLFGMTEKDILNSDWAK